MGNWNINIQGVGCHHNGKPEIDADLLAAEMVGRLVGQGHTIESATFTHGGKIDLVEASKVNVFINGVGKRVNRILSYEEVVCLGGGNRCEKVSVEFKRPDREYREQLHPSYKLEALDGTTIHVREIGLGPLPL